MCILTPHNYDEQHHYNTRKANWGAAFCVSLATLQFQIKKKVLLRVH